MHRIDHATKDTDLFGSGKHGFTEGTPGTVAATVVTDDWLNGVQEEVSNVIEDAGITLVKGTRDQLSESIQRKLDLMCLQSIPQNRISMSGYSGTVFATPTRAGTTTITSPNILAIGDSGGIYSAAFLDTWTSQTPAGGYSGSFVCGLYCEWLSMWIIAGTLGEIETSTIAATTWTQRTPGSSYSDTFRDIADNGTDRIVLVGNTGEIQSSSNGTTWTRRNSGGASMMGVLWDGSQFVAIDSSGVIWTSSDGDSWSSGVDIGAYTYTDIIYDAVHGIYIASYTSGASRSTDLTSWSNDTSSDGVTELAQIGSLVFGCGYSYTSRVWVRNASDNTWSAGTYGYNLSCVDAHKAFNYPIVGGANGDIFYGTPFKNPF